MKVQRTRFRLISLVVLAAFAFVIFLSIRSIRLSSGDGGTGGEGNETPDEEYEEQMLFTAFPEATPGSTASDEPGAETPGPETNHVPSGGQEWMVPGTPPENTASPMETPNTFGL